MTPGDYITRLLDAPKPKPPAKDTAQQADTDEALERQLLKAFLDDLEEPMPRKRTRR